MLEHLPDAFDFHPKLGCGLFAVAGEVFLILEDLSLKVAVPRESHFQPTGDEQLEHLRLGKPASAKDIYKSVQYENDGMKYYKI